MATGAVLRTMQVRAGGEVFAHVARSLLFDGRALTLVDLAPSTIWASSTPRSALGYLPTGSFLDLWDQRAQRLERPWSCRVRGTLSLLDADAHLAGDAVLTLGNPRVTATGLTYDAIIQQGVVPERSGACVLFLDWATVGTLNDGTGPPHRDSARSQHDEQARG